MIQCDFRTSAMDPVRFPHLCDEFGALSAHLRWLPSESIPHLFDGSSAISAARFATLKQQALEALFHLHPEAS